MWSREAFEATYRRHGFAVFRRCRSLLKDEVEAQDAAHEVFLHLLDKADAFRGSASLGTYLYAVATHECLDRIRNRLARDPRWRAEALEHWATHAAHPSAESVTEARQELTTLFESADGTLAAIAVYFFVDGLTQGEIAEVIGCSRATVNARVQEFRALRALQQGG